jgi:hypothetical protein
MCVCRMYVCLCISHAFMSVFVHEDHNKSLHICMYAYIHTYIQSSSVNSHLERLARSKREDWERRERIRMEAEEKAVRESCPFKPALIAQASTSTRPPNTPAVPVEVRLINEANQKMTLREQAKRFMEEKELMRTCTFKPKINETSRCVHTRTFTRVCAIVYYMHTCLCNITRHQPPARARREAV